MNRKLERIMLKNAEIVSALLTDCSSHLLVNETPWPKTDSFSDEILN
jgi:hypothetical protein